MRAIAVSKTQIHRQRHPQLLCLSQSVGDPPHQLRGPRIGTASRLPQLHNKKGSSGSRSRIAGIGIASRRNGRHRRPMTRNINAGHELKAFPLSRLKRLINLFLCKFHSRRKSFRRQESFFRIRYKGLIPQIKDSAPRTVSEIRQSIINPRIQHGHQASPACQVSISRGFPFHIKRTGCGKAGLLLGSIHVIYQFLGLFHILNFIQSGERRYQAFRNGDNRIACKKNLHLDSLICQTAYVSMKLYYQFPRFILPVKAHIQYP